MFSMRRIVGGEGAASADLDQPAGGGRGVGETESCPNHQSRALLPPAGDPPNSPFPACGRDPPNSPSPACGRDPPNSPSPACGRDPPNSPSPACGRRWREAPDEGASAASCPCPSAATAAS